MSNFNSTNKLIVYDFFAHWCGPCKMQAPVIERLEQKYLDKVIFKKIDIDSEKEIAQQYDIMSVPTIVFLHNNREIHERLRGFASDEKLCLIIDGLLEQISK